MTEQEELSKNKFSSLSFRSPTFRILCAGKWQPEEIEANDSTQAFTFPAPHAGRALAYWQELIAAGDKYLFNGELFRLENFAAAPERLSLHLSRTCYRDQIYGNARAEELLHDFGEHALPHGLGVSALVITADNYLPIIRRSEHLGEEPGKLDVVGGHAHPDQHFTNGKPDLFGAILEELEAELNLATANVISNICCGLVENLQTRKPDLVFLTHTRATMREIENGMASAVEAEEVAELLVVANVPYALARFLRLNQNELTLSACACLHLLAQL